MENTEKLKNSKEIVAYLVEKFPACFIAEGEAKPLKIGIFQDLAERLADDARVSKTMLRSALRQYTSSWRYLHGLKAGQAVSIWTAIRASCSPKSTSSMPSKPSKRAKSVSLPAVVSTPRKRRPSSHVVLPAQGRCCRQIRQAESRFQGCSRRCRSTAGQSGCRYPESGSGRPGCAGQVSGAGHHQGSDQG